MSLQERLVRILVVLDSPTRKTRTRSRTDRPPEETMKDIKIVVEKHDDGCTVQV